ncbi:MAG: transglutaminase-like cysteine peptidase [Alphaproteobacteria bacterium]|nr:transglutaminase-like cysteine peptidase [Alphaproteobacteria bacterium]
MAQGNAGQDAAPQGTFVKTVYGIFEMPGHTARASEFGKALPPVGYVSFCGRGEDECKFTGGKAENLVLTTENWDQVQQVNRYVNTKIRPATDMELYHVPDYWTYPKDAGDCEDYVLLKKRYLVGMGFNPDELLITVVLDENHEGHAVLTLLTNRGDYVLDNRRAEILRWDETGYTFLKRQSQAAANQWVSLQKSAPQVLVSTKAK